jgi:hypothetical protein
MPHIPALSTLHSLHLTPPHCFSGKHSTLS